MRYDHVLAFLPTYSPLGEDVTRVLLHDGTWDTLDFPIKDYILKMLYQSHRDPRYLQHWTYTHIGCKLNTPLTLTDTLIFIPIKVRQALGKHHSCYGYVLHDAITAYEDYQLTLAHHTTLPYLSKKTYLTKKLRDASLLCYAYKAQRKAYEG